MLKRFIHFILSLFKDGGVYYVGSADKLPEPLSKEEEIFYVTKAMEGFV